jgi:hypothetical protein
MDVHAAAVRGVAGGGIKVNFKPCDSSDHGQLGRVSEDNDVARHPRVYTPDT